jgi:hypothetical protein
MNQNRLTPIGLATVLLGAFIAIADFFIVNVALPTIDADLQPSAAMLQLVVAGYGVPYALMLVLGGRLGDLFGRRPLSSRRGVFTLFSPSAAWRRRRVPTRFAPPGSVGGVHGAAGPRHDPGRTRPRAVAGDRALRSHGGDRRRGRSRGRLIVDANIADSAGGRSSS